MTFTRFSCWELARPFLRIWHSHLHAACANHYTQRLNTKESAQVSQDIFIFINEVILSTRFNCTNTLEKTWFLWVRPLILEWSCAKHCRSCQWLTASSPHRLLLSPAPKMTLLLLLHQLHLHLNLHHHLHSAPVGQRYHLKSTFLQLFFFSHGPCTTCTCICRSALSPLRFPHFSSAPHLTLLYPQMHLLLCCKQNQEQHQKYLHFVCNYVLLVLFSICSVLARCWNNFLL